MREVWTYYRTPPADRRKDFIDVRWIAETRPGVDLLGVWDTVGSLGIPGNLLRSIGRQHYEFHDVTLGKGIRRAFQALAIDEHRRNFQPTIWDTTRATPDQEVEQAWFAGAHSNVGGGYPDPTLSDQAFLWMVDKARPLLAFDEEYLDRRVEKLEQDIVRGKAVDLRRGIWRFLGRSLREIGSDPSEIVHPSALARYAAGKIEYKGERPANPYEPFPYQPENLRRYLEKSQAT